MTAELRHAPLAHLETGDDRVRLREVPFLAQVNLRLDPVGAAATRVTAALGTPLPVVPNTCAVSADRTTLWLGPDEWLVIGPDGDASVVEQLVKQALQDEHGSVVDVSANRAVLELSGPSAREVLEKGCPIDLHPRAFGPEHCAQTILARANIVLYQVDDIPTYRILVRPSFADYLVTWLVDAMS